MLVPNPPQKPPPGYSPVEFAAHKMLRDSIAPLSRIYAPKVYGGTQPTFRPDLIPYCDAIITGQGGSGSGGSGALPANDQANAYEWVEAMWVVQNDDIVAVERPGGLRGTFNSLPAIEANGSTDVPDGAVVMLWADAAGAAEFYKFWWTGEIGGSGSGSGGSGQCPPGYQHYTIICADGSSQSVCVARS